MMDVKDTLKRKKNCGSDKPLLLLLLHNVNERI